MTQPLIEGAGGERAEADGLSLLPDEVQSAPPVGGEAAPLVHFQDLDGVAQQEVEGVELKRGLVGGLLPADRRVELGVCPRRVGAQSPEVIPGQPVVGILGSQGFEGAELGVCGVQIFFCAPREVVTFHLDQHLLGAAVVHVVHGVQRHAQRDAGGPGHT